MIQRTGRILLAVTLMSLTATTAVRAAEVETLELADGAEMRYVARGSGEPALVFVHCGNCRMSIWDESLAAFEGERRVVAMDLVGYGLSPSGPRESFTIEGYGADVAALVEHLGLAKVILVGNSLGGPVALEAAKKLGAGRVLGVVAVDTLQNAEAEWPEESWRKILDGYLADFEGTCTSFMLQIVGREASEAVRERVDRETCDGDPAAAIALFRTLREFDTGAAMRAAGVPIRAINAGVYPTAVEVNRKYAPSFEVEVLDGVGHYPQVERPEEFQRALRAAVAALAAAP